MKKQTIDLLRKEYFDVTGKSAAIRWNKTTLSKKIRDARILQAADAAEARQTVLVDTSEPKPDFERLAGNDSPVETPKPSGDIAPDSESVERRGGPRPGAGRPTGQTNERARIERLIELEVPDLGIELFVKTINNVVGRMTGVPFDKPGCEMIALAFTKLVWYWFPSLEGGSGPVSLHIQSVGLMWTAVEQRAEQVNKLQPQESPNVEKENQKENQKEGPQANPAESG